jgi:hypothetical protein
MTELTIRPQGGPEFFHRYKDDPVGFCREVLGVELFEKQVQIAESVRDNEKTAVVCGYSTGMSWLSAVLSVWRMYCHRDDVRIASLTRRQTKAILLRYIERFQYKVAERYGGTLLVAKPGCPGPREFSIEEHLDNGESEERWAGMLSSRRLRIGRPRAPHGTLFDAFHQRAPEWKAIRISAFDTPNLNGEDVPGLVTREWVDHILDKLGGASRVFKQDVLAEFPER